jgi:hypothetical protein
MNYFHIGIFLKNRKPMVGVKEYQTDDYDKVYEMVTHQLERDYKGQILKVDVWRLLPGRSQELDDYLTNKQVRTDKAIHTQHV